MASRRNLANQEAMRQLAGSAVTTSYANLGAVLAGNALVIVFTNGADKDMVVSLDGGTTDHIYLPAGSVKALDLGDKDLGITAGAQIQVKLLAAGAATAGPLVTAEVTTWKNLTI